MSRMRGKREREARKRHRRVVTFVGIGNESALRPLKLGHKHYARYIHSWTEQYLDMADPERHEGERKRIEPESNLAPRLPSYGDLQIDKETGMVDRLSMTEVLIYALLDYHHSCDHPLSCLWCSAKLIQHFGDLCPAYKAQAYRMYEEEYYVSVNEYLEKWTPCEL